jgi:NADPH-dependent 2,4-dienoyl-CoA reductase/sulfur reductase-like enzyme
MANHSRDLEYEVVVLGGGPSGVAAACTAADCGCRVALLESTPWLGGPIWRTRPGERLPRLAQRWLDRLDRSRVEVFDRTTAFACTRPDVLHAERGDEALNMGWHALILAVGSQELFLPFPGWTLPNVVGAGGLQLLGKSGWPVAGKRVVVAGTGPLSIAAAAYFVRRGARVTDILEQAPWRSLAKFALRLPVVAPAKGWQAIGFQRSLLRTRFRAGCWPVEAHGTDHVTSVTFTDGSRSWTRDCDYLACAFGLIPNLQWPMLLDCRIENDVVAVDPWQRTSVARVFCAGEATGIAGVDCALVEGQIAGFAAAGQEQAAERLFSTRAKHQRFARAMHMAFSLRAELCALATDQTVICRCEDVTFQEIKPHGDLRSAKLQTRCGMGPCQGRVCHSALRLLKGWRADSIRPPLLPTRVGSLLGMSDGLEDARR